MSMCMHLCTPYSICPFPSIAMPSQPNTSGITPRAPPRVGPSAGYPPGRCGAAARACGRLSHRNRPRPLLTWYRGTLGHISHRRAAATIRGDAGMHMHMHMCMCMCMSHAHVHVHVHAHVPPLALSLRNQKYIFRSTKRLRSGRQCPGGIHRSHTREARVASSSRQEPIGRPKESIGR